VPNIYFEDTFCGLVFLEDLGDVHLQQIVRSAKERGAVVKLYQAVIDHIIGLSHQGAVEFDRNWTYQTTDYDQNLILEKECRYFLEAFVNGYLGLDIRFEDLAPDFVSLADKALQHSSQGFMHRDMQSRNIMLKDHRIFFIDFQGGRLGPLQYDLASLLIDPYVELPPGIQAPLVDYCIHRLAAVTAVDPAEFRACYHYCTLTRNLQILGAFAYLSRVKGKKHFQNYIPAAVKTLKANLGRDGQSEFPELARVVDAVGRQPQITGGR